MDPTVTIQGNTVAIASHWLSGHTMEKDYTLLSIVAICLVTSVATIPHLYSYNYKIPL